MPITTALSDIPFSNTLSQSLSPMSDAPGDSRRTVNLLFLSVSRTMSTLSAEP